MCSVVVQSTGGTITITGSNFGSLASSISITFGGVVLTSPSIVIIVPHQSISFVYPPKDGSSTTVSVTVSNQQSSTAQFSFTAPSIVSITPKLSTKPEATGTAAGGTIVTVTGSCNLFNKRRFDCLNLMCLFLINVFEFDLQVPISVSTQPLRLRLVVALPPLLANRRPKFSSPRHRAMVRLLQLPSMPTAKSLQLSTRQRISATSHQR
jgi:hypothetical protein